MKDWHFLENQSLLGPFMFAEVRLFWSSDKDPEKNKNARLYVEMHHTCLTSLTLKEDANLSTKVEWKELGDKRICQKMTRYLDYAENINSSMALGKEFINV